MEQKTKTPLQIMADALAEMTERAMEAERQRDAAKEDANNWYSLYQRRDAQLTETIAKLDAEIEAHRCTQRSVQALIDKYEKTED